VQGTRRSPRLVWFAAGVVAIATAIVLLVATGDEAPKFGNGVLDPSRPDPFAYSPEREDRLTARATAGESHVLYAKSPDGVVASARRTARWRPLVERAAREAGVDPDVLEGMVLLESAGRPEVRASDDLEGAVGLTQILAETGQSLLGMHVDLAESKRLTRRIRRAESRGETRRARRLRARRRAADERFDPRKSLAGAGRYLKLARERFGREDLAVVSYHMGIGNLEQVIGAYGEDDPSYTQLYFDITPARHPRAYRLLAGLGDDSATYWWRVLAAREIMRLYRSDRGELSRLDRLHAAKASGEEVLHPRSRTRTFADPEDLEQAYTAGELRPFPNRPGSLGLRRDPRMGELAGRLDTEARLYRGLRPEAFALAVYLAAGVREQSGTKAPLIVTSTVRDERYQRLLAEENPEATPAYSLHTTGWAFDVERRYRTSAQAAAFQFMLDRLESLDLIAWVREPDAIHITVSSDARKLESLID
jgi:Transglycosylase SLT domain